MKHKINSLKLTLPELVLSLLALMGDIIPPCTASCNLKILSQQPPAEVEQSEPDMEEGIQLLSDMDDVNKQTYI